MINLKITQYHFVPSLLPMNSIRASNFFLISHPNRLFLWRVLNWIFDFQRRLDKLLFCRSKSLCILEWLQWLDRNWRFIAWCFIHLLQHNNLILWISRSLLLLFGIILEFRDLCYRHNIFIRLDHRSLHNLEFLKRILIYNFY